MPMMTPASLPRPTDDHTALARRIDAALPQTQCTRCGYPDCSSYARAIAADAAGINQCPPGGAEGVARLAAVTGRLALPLDPAFGVEAPRQLAVIDEAWCIGCTLCIEACPTDAIIGAPKAMHSVIALHCTGCELCVPVCPVDCIELENTSGGRTGWQAWSAHQAAQARDHYRNRTARLQRAAATDCSPRDSEHVVVTADLPVHAMLTDAARLTRKRGLIEAALIRACERAAPARQGATDD